MRSNAGGRRSFASAAALSALLLALLACGDEQGGDAGDRFSIGDRGMDAAVDSVRRSRSRPARGGATAGGSQGSRASLPEGVPAALDSGNAAFRAGNYRAALEQFESVTGEHPDVQAGWFGVYMAQRALGNRAAADSAMRRAGMGPSRAARVHGSSAADSAPAHGFTGGGDSAARGGAIGTSAPDTAGG